MDKSNGQLKGITVKNRFIETMLKQEESMKTLD